MSDWFQRHTAAATVVLMAAWLCLLAAVGLAVAGYWATAAVTAVVGLALWQPIAPTILGGTITGPRRQPSADPSPDTPRSPAA